MRVRSLVRPAQAAEAARLGMRESAAFIAGGTALQLAWQEPWKSGDAQFDLVDVAGLAESDGVALRDDWLRIGAACKLEALRRHPLVLEHAPILAAACEQIGALGVRNLATLGGNVGWRFGDALAPLLALDAHAELADGEVLPLPVVLALPRLPLILALRLPPAAPGAWTLYEKAGLRAAFTPSRLALALHVAAASGPDAGQGLPYGPLRGLRIAAAGAGLAARRLREAEALLEGSVPEDLNGGALRKSVRAACARDLPEDATRARLAARLICGHLGGGDAQ
ncbi:MAG: FAD binding domain-containing protein [Candidatus Protistobacter heckmanni]|nr:FAD binding domain-containing protein [Candidatus Protistobacter heckmanni]